MFTDLLCPKRGEGRDGQNTAGYNVGRVLTVLLRVGGKRHSWGLKGANPSDLTTSHDQSQLTGLQL